MDTSLYRHVSTLPGHQIQKRGYVAVVELSFRKSRVQTDSVRALCTQIFAARAYEAFLSGSKGHFNIRSFGPV